MHNLIVFFREKVEANGKGTLGDQRIGEGRSSASMPGLDLILHSPRRPEKFWGPSAHADPKPQAPNPPGPFRDACVLSIGLNPA